jgi:hypothetical protein
MVEHVLGRRAGERVLRLRIPGSPSPPRCPPPPAAPWATTRSSRGRRTGSARPRTLARAPPGRRRGSGDVAGRGPARTRRGRFRRSPPAGSARAHRFPGPRRPAAILRRRIQPLAADSLIPDAVLLAADHTTFDLEHDAELAAPVEQPGGQAQVLLERQRRAVEHVRVEERALAALDPPG